MADLHVFPYSIRPGTKAASMPGHLKPAIIKERAEQLRTIAAEKRSAFQHRFIGTVLQVLGQRHNARIGEVTGLSRNYLEVSYQGSAQLLNQEIMVEVDAVQHGLLTGRPITPPLR